MTEFICPKCGLQKAKNVNDTVVCPKCSGILFLTSKIKKQFYPDIEVLKRTIEDLGEKLFIAQRDHLDIQDQLLSELIEAKEFLKRLEEKQNEY